MLFSDEVYRGLEHDPADAPAGGLRRLRAGDLAGHRLQGVRPAGAAHRLARHAAIRELLERVRELKLYTTICSSAPSELLVALALRHGERLIERSRGSCSRNLPLLEDFLARRGELFEWVRPSAGPIGFPRVRAAIDVQRLVRTDRRARRRAAAARRRLRAARATCASASAARTCRRRSSASTATSADAAPARRPTGTFERNARVRSWRGLASTSAGVPDSTTTPPSMNTTLVGDLAREADLVRDDDHRHAVARELLHHGEHLADELGVERRGRLVEQHQLRLHRQRARDRHALLLAARELARVGVELVGRARRASSSSRRLRARRARARRLLTRIGAHGDVLERRHVREQVEVLEDHADLGALARDLGFAQLVQLARRPGGSRRARRRPTAARS